MLALADRYSRPLPSTRARTINNGPTLLGAPKCPIIYGKSEKERLQDLRARHVLLSFFTLARHVRPNCGRKSSPELFSRPIHVPQWGPFVRCRIFPWKRIWHRLTFKRHVHREKRNRGSSETNEISRRLFSRAFLSFFRLLSFSREVILEIAVLLVENGI